MSTFLSLWRRFARSGRGKQVAPPRARFRPTLEVLEDRLALSTLVVYKPNDDGSSGTLRWAVNKANQASSTTIDIVTGALNKPIVLTSELQLTSNVIIETPVSSPPSLLATISGGHNTDLFFVAPNTTVTLKNLKLTGGSAEDGGAIYNEGSLTLSNCTVTGNSAYYEGGAIYNTGVSAYGGDGGDNAANVKTTTFIGGEGGSNAQLFVINHSTLSGNSAAFGGAIYNNAPGGEEASIKLVKPAQLPLVGEASVTINGGSVLSGNIATGYGAYGGEGGQGGAIANYGGIIAINGATLSNNSAYGGEGYSASGQGGAIANYYGSVSITGSSLTGNTAYGGNGYWYGYHYYDGGQGGAVYNYYGSATISSSSLTKNTATNGYYYCGQGGGVDNNADFSGSLTVNQNSLITGNIAMNGPDVAAYSGSYSIVPISQIGTPVYLL